MIDHVTNYCDSLDHVSPLIIQLLRVIKNYNILQPTDSNLQNAVIIPLWPRTVFISKSNVWQSIGWLLRR